MKQGTSGRRRWAASTAAVVVAVGVAVGASAAPGAAGSAGPDGGADPETIVWVEGDAANGFGIHRLDAPATYPPTDSEARAECGEYDRLRRQVRCRTQVRVHYRDLAELQRSLEWARAQRRSG